MKPRTKTASDKLTTSTSGIRGRSVEVQQHSRTGKTGKVAQVKSHTRTRKA